MAILLLPSGAPAMVDAHAGSVALASPASVCSPSGRGGSAESTPSEYYEFRLVTTRNVPGTGRASGEGKVTFAPSPFVVSIGNDGSYVYDLTIAGVNLRAPRAGVYVAWVMTPELDQIVRLGALDEHMSVSGRVAWNKFLAAITLESEDDAGAVRWSGPIVMRGVSRSGLLHTMAGHGPFEQEPCAKYGFDN